MSSRNDKVKWNNSEETSFRSLHMAHNWIKQPSQLQTVTPSCSKRCCCAHFCPKCTKDHYTTHYKHDYQAWKLSKQQTCILQDNLNVSEGLSAADRHGKKRHPFENTTTYRSSFVAHPVQARKRQYKPVQTSHLQLGQPTCCDHCIADPCNRIVHHFKALTLETKLPTKDKDNPNSFLSTAQADFTPPKLQPRSKPLIQQKQKKIQRKTSQERNKAPFQGTTTMTDEYRAWDLPRRQSTTHKDDWKKDLNQSSFSMIAPDSAHCARCHANYKPLDNTAVRSNDTAATSKCPIPNGTIGFECVAAGASGYLPSSVDGGTTWLKCDMDKEPAQAHQMVSYMVSRQN